MGGGGRKTASKQASYCPLSPNTIDYFSALIQAGFLRGSMATEIFIIQ